MNLATFEKKGITINVTLSVNENQSRMYLETDEEKTIVQRVGYDPKKKKHFYQVAPDFAKKVFGMEIPKKIKNVKLADETAKDVEQKKKQIVKEEKEKRDQEKLEALTDDSELKLVWEHDFKSVIGFFDHPYFDGGLEKIRKSKMEISEALGRKADEVDFGDYSIKETFYITFAEFKKIVAEAEKKNAEIDTEKSEKQRRENEKIAKKFKSAKETGHPVELYRMTDACDNPNEECDLDIIVTYAMPDGTRETKRSHTW